MKKVKKLFFSIICTCMFYMICAKNFVYADVIVDWDVIEIHEHLPSFYITIIIGISIIVGISIFVLRKIYKDNQEEEKIQEGEKKENEIS